MLFGSKTPNLTGRWTGYRPTNHYVFTMEYQMEFNPNGRYSYVVMQTSGLKPMWKLDVSGEYKISGKSDSKHWGGILELRPKIPPSFPLDMEARMALVDVLGLPDERPRKFRLREQTSMNSVDFQPIEADPTDGINRCWYLKKFGK